MGHGGHPEASCLMRKLCACVRATEHAAQVELLSPKSLSRLIGVWTWFAMVCRELLSVLDKCYDFINLSPEDF